MKSSKQLNLKYGLTVVWIFIKNLYITLLLLVAVIILGTIGFVVIEGYSLDEAFYMTIITVSTVGYEEVRPLSREGRIFTALFIIITFGIFTYGVSNITSFFVEGDAVLFLRTYKMLKRINQLSNHVIICGFGRNGEAILNELELSGVPAVIIEKDPELEQVIRKYKDAYYIIGDATSDEVLINANIKQAHSLITTLPVDSDNVFIVLTARQLNPGLRIVSRANSPSVISKLKIAGANYVVQPEQIGGIQMAHLAVNPDIMEFLQMLLSDPTQGGIHFEEFSYERLKKDFKGKSIAELNVRGRTGANIIGIKKADGKYIINPSPQTVLEPGDKIILIGNEKQIKSFKEQILNLI